MFFLGICFSIFAQNSEADVFFSENPYNISSDSNEIQEQFSDSEEIPENSLVLPEITTYIDSPVIEQRQVFSAEEIEKLHSESLTDLLSSAGIQILEYGPYGMETKPSIRGFTDETVRVVIDGVCMNNAQYGTFDFSSINIESIEKIEIVRGAFTEGTEDEGAVGGVIYITTKKLYSGQNFTSETKIKSYLAAGVPIDSYHESLTYSGQFGENDYIKLNAGGTFAKNKFLYENNKGAIKKRENSEIKDGNANASYTHYFVNGNSLTISDVFYAARKEIPGPENSKNIGLQEDCINSVSLNLFNPGIADSLNLKNSLTWTRTTRFYDDDYGKTRHYINDYKLASALEFYRWEKIKQTAGLSLGYTHLNSTADGKHNQLTGVLKETTKIFFNEIFTMSIPLAVKFSGKNSEFIPKIGFSADFSYVEFILNGYRMIQFPNLDDLYWEGSGFKGNPDLKPEKGWGAEFTFNAKKFWLPFSVCTFVNYYKDKIAWSGNTPKNVKSAFYFGVDLMLKKSFFNDRIIFSASGEYLYNKLLNKSDKDTYGKRIMWTPDFTGSASLQFNFSAFNFTASADYMGKRYTSNLNINYLKPYVLLNAAFNLTAWKHFVPYVKADNILNVRYKSIEDYPMPGISITAGAKIKF